MDHALSRQKEGSGSKVLRAPRAVLLPAWSTSPALNGPPCSPTPFCICPPPGMLGVNADANMLQESMLRQWEWWVVRSAARYARNVVPSCQRARAPTTASSCCSVSADSVAAA